MAGGRPEGSLNKNKRGLKARLREQYGDQFDVIMMMGKNCKQLFDLIPEKPTLEDVDIIIDANTQLDKLAQYIEPKLKAIELTGEDGGPVQVSAVEGTIVDPANPDS